MEFDQFKIKFSSIWHASNRKKHYVVWPTFSIVFKEPSNVYGDKKGSRMSSCVIDDSAKKCSTINNGFCHFMSPQEEEKGHKMKILSLNFVSVQSKFAIFTKIHSELTLPFLYVQKLREINFVLSWSEKRFHGKSKTVKNYAKQHHLSFSRKKKKSNTFWRKFLTSSIELSGFQLSRPRNIIFFNRQKLQI